MNNVFQIVQGNLWMLALIIGYSATAQVTLKGRIIDYTKSPVPGATIHAKRISDSTRINAVVSDQQGLFLLTKIPVRDTFLLEISSIGYKTFQKQIYIKESATLDSVVLVDDIEQLDDVVVTAERPAVLTHGDTVEFNAKSFETMPFAEARELINLLPGLSRDEKGALVFNGVKISKILVNGKEYFGKEGQAALSMLPADVISKVVVMNNQEPEPGKKPEDEKVLNIELKKNVRKYGNVFAGAGSDKRYEAGAQLSVLRDSIQVAVNGFSNNTNSQGNSVAIMGSGNGITQTSGGAVDLNKMLSKKVNLTVSGAYNNVFTFQESLRSRTQFLIPDSSFFTDTNIGNRNRSNNIQLTGAVHVRKDESTRYSFSVSGQAAFSNNFSSTGTRTLDSEGTQINRLKTSYRSSGSNILLPLNFRIFKQFKRHTLNVNAAANLDQQSSTDYNLGEATFRDEANADSVVYIRQELRKQNAAQIYNLNTDYTFRLSDNISLMVNNNFGLRHGRNSSTTYILDAEQNRLGRDTLFSNEFNARTVTNGTQFNADYHKGKFTATAGLYLNYLNSQQTDVTKDTTIFQSQFNASPNLHMSYKFTPQTVMAFNYSAGVSPPTLSQLQPVRDNTNPLFIQQGNPDLNPAFSQNFGLNFNSFSESGKSFNSSFQFNPIRNKIIQAINVDESGKQIGTYENVNGVFTLSGRLGYGMYFRKPGENNTSRNLEFSVYANVIYNQDKNFINSDLATNRLLQTTTNVSANYRRGNRIAIGLSYSPTITVARYEYASSQNQEFFIHTVTNTLNLFMFRKIVFRNFIGLIHNGSLPADFTRTTTFWNFELAYVLLEKAEVKFRVYDVLKQNQNISRVANQNYIENAQSNNLQQYFMLTFKYHIR